MGRLNGRVEAFQERLFKPVDGASLAVFRMAFGLVLVWETWRYFDHGWISRYWIDPHYHFTFWGFDWVRPWPGDGMYWHWRAVALLGLLVAAGLFYRFSCALLFAAMAYLFLLDKSWYLNHVYLIVLIAFVLTLVPANRVWSLDALFRNRKEPGTVPTWALWLVRAQVAVVYFGGGIAKLNGDWLRGEPLRQWLGEREDFFVIGRFFQDEWFVYMFSYGGLFFDLFIVPLLLWRRTRPFAFAGAVLFHVTNSELFTIGVFPWLALGATTIFFDPDWPRRLLRWVSRPFATRPAAPPPSPASSVAARPALWKRQLLLGFVGAYLLLQVLMPLRHWVYPGNVHWTEEGHRFAWHMKLRDKEIEEISFFAVDPGSGAREVVYPEGYLTDFQFENMATRPDMLRQFANYVANRYEESGLARPEIRVRALIRLNDHPPQLMVDPDHDLAAESDQPFAHAEWINPLED